MKSVCLVSSPLLAEYESLAVLRSVKERYVEVPPLGVLVVAALFRNAGCAVEVVDASREYFAHIEAGAEPGTFPAALARALAARTCDLFGFSTVCSTYPLTLTVTRLLKQARPDARVVLGGPQATATAVQTLRGFPEVDAVLAGEVEHSVGEFVSHFPARAERVPGLVHRGADGAPVENPPAPLPAMEEVPEAAFDLWATGPIEKIPIEAGRGCPYGCRFCSTNRFFGRRYRVKTPQALVAEALATSRRYGARRVMLVHDHFAADRNAFHAFCGQWRSSPEMEGLTWSCSLRVDAVDDTVVEGLAASGCENVFIGMETGSQRMQSAIHKRLNLGRSRDALEKLDRAGVPTTVSFILGFPDETAADLEATLASFQEVLSRPTSQPQVLLLSPLAGSPYHDEYRERLQFDNRVSGMARQGGSLGTEEQRLVEAHPGLFSAHLAFPLEHLDRARVHDLSGFLKHATALFRWVLAAAAREVGGLARVHDLWWKQFGHGVDAGYYPTPAFRRDFVAFVRGLGAGTGLGAGAGQRLETLLAVHEIEHDRLVRLAALREAAMRKAMAEGVELTPSTVLAATCIVRPVDYSFSALIDALRGGMDLDAVPRKRCSVAASLTPDGELALSEMPGLATLLLEATRTPSSLSEILAALDPVASRWLPPSAPVQEALLYALQELIQRGLVVPA
jgi:tRNA A37 methylthiotransferase MiaB